MSVNVNTTTNTIVVQNANQTITVVDNENANIVNVTQPLVNVIEVATPGPQGPIGPQGPSGSLTGGIENYAAIWSSTGSLTTGTIFVSGNFTAIRHFEGPEDPTEPDILYINGAGVDTYNLLSAHGLQDGYIQLNVQNYSSGAYASSDIVATRNGGDENSGYINMGINSTGYSDVSYVGSANDAYLYSTGNNLYIGNAIAGRQIILFNGGFNAAANARVYIHDQGTVGINTVNTGSNPDYPPALFVAPTPSAPNTFNLITAEANLNNYTQIALFNKNAGPYASADIVAQNDLGTETDHYVDMGINSSGHTIDPTFTVGGPNDTYMLSVSTDGDHYIGSPTNGSIIMFTGDNFNGEEHAKLILKANNQHQMSGSLYVSGSITLNNLLTLIPQHPLPSGVATGSFAVSSSSPPKPYFFDGTSWNALY